MTQTSKRGSIRKEELVESIRQNLDNYERLLVLGFSNFLTEPVQAFRVQIADHSRLVGGKKSLMSVALGKDEESEHLQGLSKVSERLLEGKGEVMLLFTNAKKAEILKILKEYKVPDFINAGGVAPESFEVPAGPLPEMITGTMEPMLRELGMTTQLKNGIVSNLVHHKVVEKGQVVNPQQARLLKVFGVTMANMSFTPLCIWTKKDGKVADLE